MADRLRASLGAGPVLLDAAMGTRLIARGLRLDSDDPCLWALDRPGDVVDVHRLDVLAGSDALLTDTFGANRITLARLGRSADVAAINRGAVKLAREAAGPDRLVLGSIGPRAAGDDAATMEQVEALVDAGVDGQFLETHDRDSAIARTGLLIGAVPVPILLCVTGRDFGRDLELWPSGLSGFGTNCLGLEESLDLARGLHGRGDVPLILKPSGGLPGRPIAGPEAFAAAVPRMLALGVRMIGGCCGSTEEHIAAMRRAIDENPAPGPTTTPPDLIQ